MNNYGYKIFFDGERAVVEGKPSEIKNVAEDSPVTWYPEYSHAVSAMNGYNRTWHLKRELVNIDEPLDCLVQKCSDCGEYFLLSTNSILWFEERGYKIPKRCRCCRKKRKQ